MAHTLCTRVKDLCLAAHSSTAQMTVLTVKMKQVITFILFVSPMYTVGRSVQSTYSIIDY